MWDVRCEERKRKRKESITAEKGERRGFRREKGANEIKGAGNLPSGRKGAKRILFDVSCL